MKHECLITLNNGQYHLSNIVIKQLAIKFYLTFVRINKYFHAFLTLNAATQSCNIHPFSLLSALALLKYPLCIFQNDIGPKTSKVSIRVTASGL